MTRDALAPQAYWDRWIDYSQKRITAMQARCREPFGDPSYHPQYLSNLAKEYLHLMLERYSRGDSLEDFTEYFSALLDAREESELLGKSVFTSEQQVTRHSWSTNLDFYIFCFWLTGLALSLNVHDNEWRRLVALMGNEGEDALLDRIIATRDHDRQIGTKLRHPKPYQRLLDTVNASREDQPRMLRLFVENWYAELDRPPKKGGVTAIYDRPYWYGFDQYIDGGAYFGFWCVEAVAAVRAFNLDDSLFLGLSHYPGDLLRPDGPTTHTDDGPANPIETERSRPARQSLFKRLFGKW
ncbi:PoNe immunity protein domain-containing protein [Paraburkholderia jirisanensis]